ncbi:hypothetical protein Nmel_001433 [Mimus melanotis]
MFCCIYFPWFWDLIQSSSVIFSSSFNTPPTLKNPQKLSAATPNQTNQSSKNPPALYHNIMGRFLHLRTSLFA